MDERDVDRHDGAVKAKGQQDTRIECNAHARRNEEIPGKRAAQQARIDARPYAEEEG